MIAVEYRWMPSVLLPRRYLRGTPADRESDFFRVKERIGSAVTSTTHPFLLLGAANAAADLAAVSDMVRRKLASQFIDGDWGSNLPTETFNSAPALVPRDAFRAAFRTALTNPEVAEGLFERIAPGPDERDADGKYPDEEELFDRWFESTDSEDAPGN